jgi:hypothetical protein
MTQTSVDLIKDAEVHQKLNEKQLSYDELFHRVDKNNDGKIDVYELIELLENMGVEASAKQRVATARVSCVFWREINYVFCDFIAYYESRKWISRCIVSFISTICELCFKTRKKT